MLARIRKSMEEREEGFTLIELLVVVIIIGILAAIAIPVFLSQRNKAHDAAAQSDLKSLATAEEGYLTSNPAGYEASGASTFAKDMSDNGFKETSGVQTAVGVDGAKGYCAVAKSESGKYFWYDSQAGGLQAASTDTQTPPSTTTCSVTAAQPATIA